MEWNHEEGVWVTYVPVLDFLSTYGDTNKEAIENT
jgi:predicted RNase H-like HicB family nuclease